jgi:hypothetical protein
MPTFRGDARIATFWGNGKISPPPYESKAVLMLVIVRRAAPWVAFLTLLLTASPAGAQGRAMTFDDFLAMPVVSDPQVSPDGGQVAYTVTDYSLDDNRGTTRIWIAGECAESALERKNVPSAVPRSVFMRAKLMSNSFSKTARVIR